jgi:CHAD domain-containing protein
VKQLAEHLGGVRLGEDIESIHCARVASRRLRAALDMFRACWKRKQVKAWKKPIRQLAQNLGEARDHDVLIEFLASSLAAVSDRVLVPGIACLLNHVERQRQWIQPRVLKAIDQFETDGVLKSIQAAIRLILEEAGDAPFVASKHAHSLAGKMVRKGVKKLLDEAPGLAAPEQQKRHHAMRIAAKRLRYTLELARPVYSGNLAEILDSVKRVQTLLGEIHDCDVWVEKFTEFAHKESCEIQLYFGSPQRFERMRPGLDYLRQERKDRRCQAFGELVAFWQELKDRGVWDRLATILEWGGAGTKSQEKCSDSRPASVAPQA